MKTYYWCDGSGRIEFKLTQAQIDCVCHSGSNDAAVSAIEKPEIDPQDLKKALREYGAWDDADLADHAANLKRIVWIACWDCFDDPATYCEN